MPLLYLTLMMERELIRARVTNEMERSTVTKVFVMSSKRGERGTAHYLTAAWSRRPVRWRNLTLLANRYHELTIESDFYHSLHTTGYSTYLTTSPRYCACIPRVGLRCIQVMLTLLCSCHTVHDRVLWMHMSAERRRSRVKPPWGTRRYPGSSNRL